MSKSTRNSGKSWSAAGAHTLVIEVLGTAGHPYVAIDGFTVVD